jgi:hypothetical protein
MSRLSQVTDFIQQNGLRIATEVVVNLALPYAIFDLTQPHIGEVRALLAASAPPMLWSIVEFARNRRIDAVSVLALLGIGLSLVAFIGTGSVRLLQLRERLVSILIAAIFLGSAAIGRPVIYELAKAGLARANNHAELARFETLRNDVFFRNSMTIMTLVWGFGLLFDAVFSIVLVFAVPIRTYLILSPVLGYATLGSLVLWNIWFARKRRREGDARRAAAALANAGATSQS